MKKIFSKILSVMLAVISVMTIASVAQPAMAREFGDQKTDEFVYRFGDDGKIEIGEYLKDDDVVTIPNEINGIPVSGIGSEAFKNKNVRKIILPNNMRRVTGDGFVECSNLEEVIFNDGFEELGERAFFNCPSLIEIHLPSSCYKLSETMIDECSGIKRIIIDSEAPSFKGHYLDYILLEKDATIMLKSLPDTDFYCSLANEGYFLSGKENGYYIFEAKKEQQEYSSGNFIYTLDKDDNAEITGYTGPADAPLLDIPAELGSHKVVSIGTKAFECIIDNSVKYRPSTKYRIGKYTPRYEFLAVRLPSTLKKIGDFAFRGCTSLEFVSIPDSVEYIGYDAFSLCTSLADTDLPASLKTLCGQAFAFCPFNGELKLPKTIEYIGASAFEECGNITAVEFPRSLKFVGLDAFAESKIESIKIPNTLKHWYGAMSTCQQLKNVEIEDGVTAIDPEAFHYCELLESITLPDSIKKIGESAFEDCFALKNVIVGENSNIEVIDRYAFKNTEITNADFAKNAELKSSAFCNTEITSFTFTEKQKYIPQHILRDCKSLSEVKFENGVVSIGYGAFSHSTVKNIDMPDSIIHVGKVAFYECTELETVKISKNVKYILEAAFENCEKLYKVTWDRVGSKYIKYDAFYGCKSLTDFAFRDITSVDEGAFNESGIADVKLTLSNLETQAVEKGSFKSFTQLKTLEVGGNVKEIRTLAFASCKNLETAVIADSVEKIADNAFDYCDKLTIYCNENSYAESYAKANGIKVTTLIVDPIANQSYTGKKLEPQVSVRFSDRKLTSNKDYSTEYINNINVGTANVIVTGLEDFSMLVTKVDFAIIAVSIDKAEIVSIPTQTTNGLTPCEPKVKVKFNGKTLKEGEDYTVSYKNNGSAGTATATIKGIGNFKGTASVDFNIEVKQGFKDKVQVAFNAVKAAFVKAINWFLKLFK